MDSEAGVAKRIHCFKNETNEPKASALATYQNTS